ncbi:MAG TPA: hypothetical protein VN694_12025 [Caulobacteraceae bacterium]|nr:hypothetical protein [Caulobacteraceae bacterium]
MKFSKPNFGAKFGAGAAIALMTGLAACNNAGASDGRLALTGSAFCTPFQKAGATPTANNQSGLATTPASTASDPGAAFDDCIHRWGYAMAPARDPADIVAHAAVDACGAQMNAWNQQVLAQAQEQNPQYQTQPPISRRGRQPMLDQQQQQNPQQQALAQHMQIAEARSLFYVIQARAAGCAPPPANTLVSNPAT